MKNIIILMINALLFVHCSGANKHIKNDSKDEFSFIFMTDIHLKPESGAPEAFQMAIDTANQLGADFVLTGGDLVYDVLRGNYNRSDSLFIAYKKAIEGFNIPVYHCIGNHELFGIYEESDVDSTHPDYKYGMFERHLGETYYSFDHKGWHFIVLNSIDEKDKRYIGIIGEEQMDWLEKDLANIDPTTPIAVAMHIPLVSTQRQIFPKSPPEEAPNELWIYNREEVLALFENHNLKLALQGHLHWLEDVNVMGKTRFITGGAIAGRPSWRGTRTGEEGFLVIHIKGEEIDWDYIDIGWEARQEVQ